MKKFYRTAGIITGSLILISILLVLFLNFYYTSLYQQSLAEEQDLQGTAIEYPVFDNKQADERPEKLNLVPYPKKVSFGNGLFTMPEQISFSAADSLQPLIKGYLNRLLAADSRTVSNQGLIQFTENPVLSAEGYTLDVSPTNIRINYSTAAGLYYALVSLKHINLQYSGSIPVMQIEDYPDLEVRGFMMDIGRDKIPTLATLKDLADLLSDLKYNHFEMYMEGFAFAYPSYTRLWQGTETPVTPEEFRALDSYCKERFIDLVPNQNSLGHMMAWLATEEFAPLAECPNGFKLTPFINMKGTLDPYDPRSLQLVEQMMDDLLPNFSSACFNANLDEPFELGQCKSRKAAKEKGVGRIFLEFALKVDSLTRRHGKKMMMWADMASRHPEIIADIPPQITLLEWGYEAEHPFDEKCSALAEGDFDFFVCPGTSSWTTLTGRTENMYGNIYNAVTSGLNHGARGMLLTDWGDMGHWQYLPVSYAPLTYAAGTSWNAMGLTEDQLVAYLNRYVFKDAPGLMGDFVLDMGRYNQFEEWLLPNMTMTMLVYQLGLMDRVMYSKIPEIMGETFRNLAGEQFNMEDLEARLQNVQPFRYRELLDYLAKQEELLFQSMMECEDASLVVKEYANAINMIRLGAHIQEYILTGNEMEPDECIAFLEEMDLLCTSVLNEHERLWMSRNRPGGFDRSTTALNHLNQQIGMEIDRLDQGGVNLAMHRFRERVVAALVNIIL